MIAPLILAAGEGRRMHLQETSKVMLSVDRVTPLIGNAAIRFLSNGYTPGEISVMTGAYRDQVIDYLDDDFKFYEQQSIGDPTDGLMQWIREISLEETSNNAPYLVAVMNADDACWNTTRLTQDLLNACSSNGAEGILLSTSYEHGQHKTGFFNNNSTLLATNDGYHSNASYAAGLFIIDPSKFSAYIDQCKPGMVRNVVTYFRDHTDKRSVIAHTDPQPRVCVNTREALFYARHIYDQRK